MDLKETGCEMWLWFICLKKGANEEFLWARQRILMLLHIGEFFDDLRDY
jgi:hypothetical protein